MIQEFLNLQFIKTTDDANFDKLKKACADVVKKVSRDKAKISAYTLVALDPEISAENSDIMEVKQLIIYHWSTFVANSKDTAVTFIRAVMLDALKTISNQTTSSACLIWFSGRNVIKHYKLGREKEILTKFLLDLGNKIENEVSESWSFSPDEEIDIPEITPAAIDKGEIEVVLKAAAAQITVGGENPHWASGNDTNWPTFFATRAGKGLTDIINKTSKKQVTEILSNQSEFVKQNSLLQMRTQLLWWKEAGYSLSFKGSYKELKEGMLQVILALDYSSFVPSMYPTSVDYFLKETHNSLSALAERKIKIVDVLKSIEESSNELKTVLAEFTGEESRVSFINFIRGLVHGKFKAKQFKGLVGIADSTELTFAELTIWLFHDFHSLKISTTK
jgi:hypothetical protein